METLQKWKGLKKSPAPTPCLQARHFEIFEDRWLLDLFLEIAMDRDYTGSLVRWFPKRTSRLYLTVLFFSIILPYKKQFINRSRYWTN